GWLAEDQGARRRQVGLTFWAVATLPRGGINQYSSTTCTQPAQSRCPGPDLPARNLPKKVPHCSQKERRTEGMAAWRGDRQRPVVRLGSKPMASNALQHRLAAGALPGRKRNLSFVRAEKE